MIVLLVMVMALELAQVKFLPVGGYHYRATMRDSLVVDSAALGCSALMEF
jgi:hypothetical protein